MTVNPKDVFLASLLLEGDNGLKAELAPVLESARLKRTSDGVSNLELTAYDKHLNLLRSNIMNTRITAQLDGQGYELVQTKKSGYRLTIVFEDIAVAEMRRHDSPRKFAAGTVTRVEAAQLLLQEIPWVKLAVGTNKPEKIKVELARGQLSAVPVDQAPDAVSGPDPNYFNGSGSGAADTGTKTRETTVADKNREDTWTCIKRWFAEVNWRCYVDRGVVNVGPDSAYIAGDPVYALTDGDKGLTTPIDFDWDVGKPMATASFTAALDRYSAPPGTCVELKDMGPASGKWLVSETDRDLFKYTTSIKLKYPEPDLPEPEAPPMPDANQDAAGSYFGDLMSQLSGLGSTGVGAGAGGTARWKWPLNGSHTISSGFGPRSSPGSGGSSNHKGIDIVAPQGQAILAARDGYVTHAGPLGGYGNCVVVTHGGDPLDNGSVNIYCESRYAHMSAVGVRHGIKVVQGQLLGLVGMTGNTTGPHLHFEICRGTGASAVQINPLPILMGVSDF